MASVPCGCIHSAFPGQSQRFFTNPPFSRKLSCRVAVKEGDLSTSEVRRNTGGASIGTFQDLQKAQPGTVSYCQMELLCKVA